MNSTFFNFFRGSTKTLVEEDYPGVKCRFGRHDLEYATAAELCSKMPL